MSFRIAFFHANGYPPGVYAKFFEALNAAMNAANVTGKIVTAPFLDTAIDCKANLRWPTMLGVAQQHAASSDANVLIGHSMGGYLALQVAASRLRAGAKIESVFLIDSPIPRTWRSGLLTFSQLTGLAYKFGPAPIANARRDRWLNRNSAREHFAKKAFVKRWADGVLDDFVTHALRDDADEVTLAIPRAAERDIYAHIVHRYALKALRDVRRAGVSVTFLAGTASDEMRLAGYASNRAPFSPRFIELEDVGHLIPMEAPARCAALIALQLASTHAVLAKT